MRSMGIAKITQTDLVYMGELGQAGKVVPVIEKCYPLNEGAEAIRYLAAGHAKAKVIISIR